MAPNFKGSDPSFAEMITPGKITERFEIGSVIGQGAYSTVRVAREKGSDQLVAIKYIQRHRAFGDMDLNLECRLLRQLGRHDNINAFVGLYEDSKYYMIVLEYVKGGELLDILTKRVEQGNAPYSEAQVAVIMRQIVSAVKHCHMNNIVHRDLKPENILVSDQGALGETMSLFDAPLKLADFGLATIIKPGEKLTETCGTPNYMAPERLKRGRYDEKSDMWSIGVMMYILVAGTFPFYGETDEEIKLCACNPHEPEFGPEFRNVSPAFIHLLRDGLLAKDPANRPTAAQVLVHPWMTGELASTAEIKGALTQLKRFNARRKFRAGVRALVASNRLRNFMGAVQNEAVLFELVDFGITTDMVKNLNKVFGEKTHGTYSANHDLFVWGLTRQLGIPKERLIEELYTIFNRGGHVPTRDFCLSLATKLGLGERESLDLAFEIFDSDGSGLIDQAEYSAMISAILMSLEDSFKPNELWLQQEFEAADTDRSGQISRDEFVAAAGSNIKIKAYLNKVQRMLQTHSTEANVGLCKKAQARTGEVFIFKDRGSLFWNIPRERWMVADNDQLILYRSEKDWQVKKSPKYSFKPRAVVVHHKPEVVRANCKVTLEDTKSKSTYTMETRTPNELKMWVLTLRDMGAILAASTNNMLRV